MEIKIRRAKTNEAGLLSDLCIRSKRSNGYDDAFMQACLEELTVTEVSLAEHEYWVADAETIIAGCVCLSVNPAENSGEIETFFIDPDWQRKGIGRLLWTKIFKRASDYGLARLYLDADPNAVPFYDAMGFETIGHTPSESIPGRTLPKMMIDLEKYDGNQ